MTVGILLVTHGLTGETLIETARAALGGKLPLKTRALAVPLSCDPNASTQDARRLCLEINGDGVLILSDLYGSTPCNISTNCYREGAVHIVSGVNLAMLIKVMNYHALDLPALTEKALAGGRDGVMECRK